MKYYLMNMTETDALLKKDLKIFYAGVLLGILGGFLSSLFVTLLVKFLDLT